MQENERSQIENAFASLSIDRNSTDTQQNRFLTPPRESQPGIRVFGSSANEGNEAATFSFRFLHNASPLPSPRTSVSGDRPRLKLSSTAPAEQSSSYNVDDEKPPENAMFFTQRFQTQLAHGKIIASTIGGIFNQFELKEGSNSRRLQDDARRLRSFHTTDNRIIALLGDSGEGERISLVPRTLDLTWLTAAQGKAASSTLCSIAAV